MENSILNKLSNVDVLYFEDFEEKKLEINNLSYNTNLLIKEKIDKFYEEEKLLIKINNLDEFKSLLQKEFKSTDYDISGIINYPHLYLPFYISKSLKFRIGKEKLNDECFHLSTLKYEIEKLKPELIFFNRNKIKCTVKIDEHLSYRKNISNLEILSDCDKKIYNHIKKIYSDLIEDTIEEIKRRRNITYETCIKELDENNDSEIDLFENELIKILEQNQEKIILKDRNYVQQFIKISSYLNTKKNNIQVIFNSLKELKTDFQIEERKGLIKNQIFTYELLLFNSINMLTALIDDNMIVFFEIYEKFDKLNIFNSNWENEISNKLNNIDKKLDDVINSIDKMETKLVHEIQNLSYTTQSSFDNLNISVSKHLSEINSKLNINNLLNGIQTYQLYKINKNTKNNE